MTRNGVTDEQLGQLHKRTDEVIRRTAEGTLAFESTMQALQDIIEGKHEPKETADRKMVLCEAWNGNRCSICGGYFDEGGICNYGHERGCSYSR